MKEILHLKITKCSYQYYIVMYSTFFQKKIYINFDLSIMKVFWIARHILTNEKKLVKKLKLLKRDPKLWSIERMTFYRIRDIKNMVNHSFDNKEVTSIRYFIIVYPHNKENYWIII